MEKQTGIPSLNQNWSESDTYYITFPLEVSSFFFFQATIIHPSIQVLIHRIDRNTHHGLHAQ
jgi:hypothetical protein